MKTSDYHIRKHYPLPLAKEMAKCMRRMTGDKVDIIVRRDGRGGAVVIRKEPGGKEIPV